MRKMPQSNTQKENKIDDILNTIIQGDTLANHYKK